jgi:hypothetical protein
MAVSSDSRFANLEISISTGTPEDAVNRSSGTRFR